LSIENVDISPPIHTFSDNDIVQNIVNRSDTTENEYETRIEDGKPIRQRTIEEIMAESDISFDNLNDDQIESKNLSQSSIKTSIKDRNFSLETDRKLTLSFSDDEISTEQFENELADMQTKSKDIEEMVEKFLLKK
jgi:hypothetical protein